MLQESERVEEVKGGKWFPVKMADPAEAPDSFYTLGSFNACIGSGVIEVDHVRKLELDSLQTTEIQKRAQPFKNSS